MIAVVVAISVLTAQAATSGLYDSLHSGCASETARTTAEIVREGKKLGTPVDQARLSSPAAIYMEQVQTEACTHKKLKDQLQESPAKVCAPKQATLDCVYSLIRTRAHVTAGLTMAQVLLVYAGLKDQEKATDKSIVQIQLADKLIHVIEDAELDAFFLAKLKVSGEDAATELASLRTQDELQFGGAVNKTLASVEKDLSEIPLTTKPRTTLDQWKSASVSQLRARLAKLKAKEWRYK